MMNYLLKPLVIIDSAYFWVSGLPYPFSEWYFLGTVFLALMLLDILVTVKIKGSSVRQKKSSENGEKIAGKQDEPQDTDTKGDHALPEIKDVNTLKAAVKSDSCNLSYEDICGYEAEIYKDILNDMYNPGEGYSDEETEETGVLSTIVDDINTKEDEESRESEHESKKRQEKEQRLSQINQNFNKKIPKSLAGNTVDDIDI